MVTVEHLMDEFQSNHEFYRSGGITVSGGEPLLQPEFLADLFRAMHNNPDGRVHTCLDSCGYAFDPNHPRSSMPFSTRPTWCCSTSSMPIRLSIKKLTGCDPARIRRLAMSWRDAGSRSLSATWWCRALPTRWRSAGTRSPHRSMAQRGGPGNAAVSHDGCRQVRATGHSL